MGLKRKQKKFRGNSGGDMGRTEGEGMEVDLTKDIICMCGILKQ